MGYSLGHAVVSDNNTAIPTDCEVAASPTDERLTDKEAEDSVDAGLHHKDVQSNVVVESDGPESDRPETTASMGTYASPSSVQCITGHCTSVIFVAASMIEQSLEGWRLIGHAMQSLFTCNCFSGVQQSRNPLNQLRSAGRER